MDLFLHFENHIRRAFAALEPGHRDDISCFSVMPAKGRGRGDLSTNAALVLAASAEKDTQAAAHLLAGHLRNISDVLKAEVAGAGFINITIASRCWSALLHAVLVAGDRYGAGIGVEQGKSKAASRITGDLHADAIASAVFRIRAYACDADALPAMELDRAALASFAEEKGIGTDAFLFSLISTAAGSVPDLRFATEAGPENPVFWIQYAHARCVAVLTSAPAFAFPQGREGDDSPQIFDALVDVGERRLLAIIARYPRAIADADRRGEPGVIASHLRDLADALHSQFNRSRDMPHLRFIRDDNRLLTGARLALVRGVRNILTSGLALLGVSAPNEMR